MRPYSLPVIAVLGVSCVFGQMRNGFSVRGEVEHDPGDRVEDLYVELYEQERHTLVEKVGVGLDGSFELRQAATGNYEIRLVDRSGNGIHSEYSSLNAGSQTVTFRLTGARPKTPGGAVSLEALKRRVDRKAMREFHLAVKAGGRGEVQSSFTHLRKSIRLDPGYAPAHNQLGLLFATLGDETNALLEFQTTVKLDPSLVIPHANLGIALLRADRASEAEIEARRAIQVDPNYAKGHYVLALCLLRQKKHGDEALAELRRCSEAFPQARSIIEQLAASSR